MLGATLDQLLVFSPIKKKSLLQKEVEITLAVGGGSHRGKFHDDFI